MNYNREVLLITLEKCSFSVNFLGCGGLVVYQQNDLSVSPPPVNATHDKFYYSKFWADSRKKNQIFLNTGATTTLLARWKFSSVIFYHNLCSPKCRYSDLRVVLLFYQKIHDCGQFKKPKWRKNIEFLSGFSWKSKIKSLSYHCVA